MPLLYLLLGALLAYQPIHDMDLPMHVAAGRWILAHGIPHQDPFSYTAAGRPWVDHEWLSQILFALTDRVGGLQAIKLLGCSLVGVGLWLWHRAFRAAGVAAFGAVCLTLLVAILFTHRVHVRPHLFGFLAEALFVLALFRPPRSRALQVAAAVGFLLWVQLHGGWLLAPLTLGATAAAAALGHGPRAALAPLLAAGALGALACLNPAGWQLFHAPFSVGGISPLIPEWWPILSQDPSYADKKVYTVLIAPLAGLGVILGWKTAPAPALGLALVCGFLGLSSARFLYLLPAALLPLATLSRLARRDDPSQIPSGNAATRGSSIRTRTPSPALRRFLGRLPAWLVRREARALLGVALVAILARQVGDRWSRLLGLPGGPWSGFFPGRFPVEAVDRLEQAGFAGSVFAPPTWTSYLLYRLGERVRVCIDGRVEVYGAAIASDMLRMDQPPASLEVVARYPADLVLTPHGWMAPGPPGHVLVHRDDLAEMFVQDRPELRSLRERLRTPR